MKYVATVLLFLAACGGSASKAPAADETTPASSDPAPSDPAPAPEDEEAPADEDYGAGPGEESIGVDQACFDECLAYGDTTTDSCRETCYTEPADDESDEW